jgi:hypothetical protein
MKTLVVLFLAVTAISAEYAQSQDKQLIQLKGKYEISPSLSFQFDKWKTGDEYVYKGFTVNMPMAFSYFLSNRTCLGAELMLTLFTDNLDLRNILKSNRSVIVSLLMENDFPTSYVIPFITYGYGISNDARPFENMAVGGDELGRILGVVNLGAGLKFPITNWLLIRTDFRYMFLHGSYTSDLSEEYSYKIRENYLRAYFGFCFLL